MQDSSGEPAPSEPAPSEPAPSEHASTENKGQSDNSAHQRLEELRAAYLSAAAEAGVSVTVDEKKEVIDPRWGSIPAARTITEEGKLELTDNPHEAVRINDQYRRADVPDGHGSGLWTADQVRATTPRVYKFEAPTFAPPRWGTNRMIGQDTYSCSFASEFPEIANVLPMSNIVVAGGAAAWPFSDPTKKASDVDFFLYGLPADDSEPSRKTRWSCIAALVDKIRKQFTQCIEMLAAGVITIKAIRPFNSDQAVQLPPMVKIQIILRAYPTVSSILHGFDVPSCCVAYDGYIACMTYLAAFAHVFHTNVIVPSYRSTTYESRLLKYFERGYALVMPHLNMATMTRGEKLVMPYLTLAPAVIRGRFATGVVTLNSTQPESDYDFVKVRHSRHSRWRDFSDGIFGQPYINLKMVAVNRPVVTMGVTTNDVLQIRPRRRRARPIEKGLPFGTFWQEPTRSEIFSRLQLGKVISATTKAVISKTGKLDVAVLRNIFGLDLEQVMRLAQTVGDVWESARRENARIDVSPSLDPFCAALLAKYDSQPERIDWWILADPARQHTASLNPRCEEPSQWYGSYYIESIAPPTIQETLETIIGIHENRILARDNGAAFDGTCPICHDDVHSGDTNSVTMPCGHAYHWAPYLACGGLYTWVVNGNTSCPLCRADPITDFNPTTDLSATPIYISMNL